MKVAILFFSTNRPEFLIPTLDSFETYIDFSGLDTQKIFIDDYPKNRSTAFFWSLKNVHGIDEMVLNKENFGQSATWSEAWNLVPEDVDYIWHQEDDFIFRQKIKVKNLINMFDSCPVQLNQIALKRQVWYEGGKDFIGQVEDGSIGKEIEFESNNDTTGEKESCNLILHQHYFNANPCIYPRWVIEEKYKHNPQESVIIDNLKRKYPEKYCAILGKRADPALTEHIGVYTQGKKVLEGEPGWDWLKEFDPNKKYLSQGYLQEYSKEE
jgi:hypothetical protein